MRRGEEEVIEEEDNSRMIREERNMIGGRGINRRLEEVKKGGRGDGKRGRGEVKRGGRERRRKAQSTPLKCKALNLCTLPIYAHNRSFHVLCKTG